MSAMLETCPEEVRERVLPGFDEIGNYCKSFRAKVASYPTTEQSGGGNIDATGPMDISNADSRMEGQR